MKKWIWLVGTLGLLIVGNLCLKLQKEEFYIYNSMKYSFDNYVETTLQVIVNRSDCDVEEMFEKIYLFYCKEQTVNKLTVNLYESVKDLEAGKIKAKQEFIINEIAD